MASGQSEGGDKKPLLDLDADKAEENSQGGESRNSLQAGEVDIQEWERRLVTGDLPEDFLQVTEPTASVTPFGEKPKETTEHKTPTKVVTPTNENRDQIPADESALPEAAEAADHRLKSTEETDHELAMALQRQLDMEAAEGEVPFPHVHGVVGAPMVMNVPANMVGRLTVTVVEARLARNYGITRMDPYCRVRIGHNVYQTPTCPSGAREPKWNKTFNCFLLKGVKHVDIEVYDECTFSSDALIAHGVFDIPEAVVQRGVVVDEWWPLSGQEGHDKEGMIHLIMSLQPFRADAMPHPEERPNRPAEPPKMTEDQLTDFTKMFPNLEPDIIKSVFIEKQGNLDETVNCLLQMSQQ